VFYFRLNCSDGDWDCGNVYFPLVTKYRDFSYLIGFGVQLLMYVSRGLPYWLKKMPDYAWPFNTTHCFIETTRYMLLNVSIYLGLGYTLVVTCCLLVGIDI
jgi:lipopolysaccharide transport system permease protein